MGHTELTHPLPLTDRFFSEKEDHVSVVDENDLLAKTHDENAGHYVLDVE